MSTITITLPDDHIRKLREIATYYHVAPEELVRVSIEELIIRSDEDFHRALDYVLNKNVEIYRRLA